MYKSLIQPEYCHELRKSISVHISASISGYVTVRFIITQCVMLCSLAAQQLRINVILQS